MFFLQNKIYENVSISPAISETISMAAYVNGESIAFSSFWIPAWSQYFPPEIKTEIHIDKEMIYAGLFQGTFGHFFHETLSRLWYAKLKPEIPLLFPCQEANIPTWMQEVFDLLEIKNEIIFCEQPVKVKKVHFPTPLMSHQHYVSREFFEFLNVFDAPEQVPRKKIFISRGKNPMGYQNNQEIEDYAVREGYQVFIPEECTMIERLMKLGSAEEILAVEGSSLFSLSLIKNLKTKIYIIERQHDPSILSMTPNLYLLDTKRLCVVQDFSSFNSNFILDMNSLDYAIKEKKYKHATILPEPTEDIFQKEEAFRKKRCLWYDSLIHACFIKEEAEKKKLIQIAWEDFRTNKELFTRESLMSYKNISLSEYRHPLYYFSLALGVALSRAHKSDTYKYLIQEIFSLDIFSVPVTSTALYFVLNNAKKSLTALEIIELETNFIEQNKDSGATMMNLHVQLSLLTLYREIHDIDNCYTTLNKIINNDELCLRYVKPEIFLDRVLKFLLATKEYTKLIDFLEKNKTTVMPWAIEWQKALVVAYGMNGDKNNALRSAQEVAILTGEVEKTQVSKFQHIKKYIKYYNYYFLSKIAFFSASKRCKYEVKKTKYKIQLIKSIYLSEYTT